MIDFSNDTLRESAMITISNVPICINIPAMSLSLFLCDSITFSQHWRKKNQWAQAWRYCEFRTQRSPLRKCLLMTQNGCSVWKLHIIERPGRNRCKDINQGEIKLFFFYLKTDTSKLLLSSRDLHMPNLNEADENGNSRRSFSSLYTHVNIRLSDCSVFTADLQNDERRGDDVRVTTAAVR